VIEIEGVRICHPVRYLLELSADDRVSFQKHVLRLGLHGLRKTPPNGQSWRAYHEEL
jgi:hypothetical protein